MATWHAQLPSPHMLVLVHVWLRGHGSTLCASSTAAPIAALPRSHHHTSHVRAALACTSSSSSAASAPDCSRSDASVSALAAWLRWMSSSSWDSVLRCSLARNGSTSLPLSLLPAACAAEALLLTLRIGPARAHA
eukprot:355081-Chlamydomonas_euryale.AAC.1